MSVTHRADIRLLVALALSVALHAALLSMRITSLRDVALPAQRLEVRLGYLRATQMNTQPTLRADLSPTLSRSPDTARAKPPRPTREEEVPTISDVLPSEPPDRTPPVARSSDIASPVPSARTSFWSPAARWPASAEAAYVAQRQHQALLNQQLLMQAVRGQYEARLMESLHRQRVTGPCKVVLPEDGEPRARCDQPPDTESIVAALNELGNVPPAPEARTWLIVELAPGRLDAPAQLISRRVDYDPDE